MMANRHTIQLPVFGLGHSLGSKIHVLLGSSRYNMLLPRRRRANVLISFNNFSAKQSVPLLDELKKIGEAVGVVKGLDLTSKVRVPLYVYMYIHTCASC